MLPSSSAVLPGNFLDDAGDELALQIGSSLSLLSLNDGALASEISLNLTLPGFGSSAPGISGPVSIDPQGEAILAEIEDLLRKLSPSGFSATDAANLGTLIEQLFENVSPDQERARADALQSLFSRYPVFRNASQQRSSTAGFRRLLLSPFLESESASEFAGTDRRGCHLYRSPRDGVNGFVWKPVSESDGRPVVLFPPSMNVEKVQAIYGNGKVIQTLRIVGRTNGYRVTARSSGGLPGSLFVRATVNLGSEKKLVCYKIPNSRSRYD
jgi:hypothetical protein